MQLAIDLVERGFVPDWATRLGIRNLLLRRLGERHQDVERDRQDQHDFIAKLRGSPIAIDTGKANEQHYEVPPEFFQMALGKRLKYSSCIYPSGSEGLDAAEEHMLALTCDRAQIRDGMEILELGCGWGSLTLWMAEKYPAAKITAVSNSAPQRLFIEGRCRERGFKNVQVITCDMNAFAIDRKFDRVVSVEMFEHMRNYKELLSRISGWLKDDGKLFFHIFVHDSYAYPFADEKNDDWMARHFFSGGIMPSDDLMLYFQDDLVVERHDRVSGVHYAQTSEDWLKNLDRHRHEVIRLFEKDMPRREAIRQTNRWRMFFMACAELFGFRGGQEWYVSHYLYRRRGGVG